MNESRSRGAAPRLWPRADARPNSPLSHSFSQVSPRKCCMTLMQQRFDGLQITFPPVPSWSRKIAHVFSTLCLETNTREQFGSCATTKSILVARNIEFCFSLHHTFYLVSRTEPWNAYENQGTGASSPPRFGCRLGINDSTVAGLLSFAGFRSETWSF